MPAIRLLSSQNALLSPFDHAGDHPSIHLLSPAITLHLSPLYPGGIAAPLSAGRRACQHPRKREGWKDLVVVTTIITRNQHSPSQPAATDRRNAKALQTLRARRPAITKLLFSANSYLPSAITACADTAPTRRNCAEANSRFACTFGIQPHDGKSREGIYARVAASPSTLVERQSRARGRRQSMPRSQACFSQTRGVGGGFSPAPDNSHPPSLSRRLPENLLRFRHGSRVLPKNSGLENSGGGGLENSGRPVLKIQRCVV